MTTTLEEIMKCPNKYCRQPGKKINSEPFNGLILHTVACLNERCEDKELNWTYTTYPNGTLALPKENRKKEFPIFDSNIGARLQAQGAQLLEKSLNEKNNEVD